MIIFNGLGSMFGFVGILANLATLGVLGEQDAGLMPATIGLCTMAMIDFGYRLCNRDDSDWTRFLVPHLGGHIMFVPLWALAIGTLGYTLISGTTP